ncbi:MAG: hypothetical protein CME62_10185 [Halobacteriovoraceae bacterium]|nr:hypothetical protein [Halobacteriovoraceae bacterium]|tara:strand:+ start:18061 stop:19752 length:1692 start_codon:yes stop_codon:yes gene_type:complete
MKFLILLVLLSTQVYASGENPRETMRIFLKAMVKVKNNVAPLSTHYSKAIETLDIAEKDPLLRYDIGKSYANQLIKTLDRIKKVDYDQIPASFEGSKWYFDERSFNDESLEISLIQKDSKWYFSRDTLESLKLYREALQGNQLVAGVLKLNTLTDRIKTELPPIFSEKAFLFYNWQWLALLVVIIFSLIVKTVFDKVLRIILSKSFKVVKDYSSAKLQYALKPLEKIVFWTVLLQLIPLLEFQPTTIATTKRILYIVMSFYCVWLGHRLIDLMTFYFTDRAKSTESKFDDIIIPLLSKTAFVIIYILGGILIANSLTIDVTGLIAGLGIGGLAFAFAAKDTLANFFGSIMLVLDRPFDIGDIITAGDVEGIVDEVGFRSTRIRTFNDSLITISNGELMNRPIDNKGKRRYRRVVTALGLEYDTPAEKIEAFCEGIRQIIINHKWTRKDSFHVYFESFGDFSLNVKVICYWETDDYARELAEKHRLLIDILRLAEKINVSFAFPTQTIHMFQEEKVLKQKLEGEFRAIGRQSASEVTKAPLTLKNPRSNVQDEEHFGKNDIERG